MAAEYKLSYTASEIDERLGKVDEIETLRQSMFSGDYNDLKNAPNVVEDGEGGLYVVDEDGNIIFRVDEAGIHSTALSVNGMDVLSIIRTEIDSAIGNAIAASY